MPRVINVDKNRSYPVAVQDLKHSLRALSLLLSFPKLQLRGRGRRFERLDIRDGARQRPLWVLLHNHLLKVCDSHFW